MERVKVTLRISPKLRDFLQEEAEARSYNLNTWITMLLNGDVVRGKFRPASEITAKQALRGQSKAIKYYWGMIQRWLEGYRIKGYQGDPEAFARDFGDLIAEAESFLKQGSEAGLQEFINSGKLRTRWLEKFQTRLGETPPLAEARSVFERVGSGELE